MSKQPSKCQVLVVGGGLAGLAAAITAAHSGAAVVLLERSDALGGRARSRNVRGFVFNLGPHALYPTTQGLLKELGVSVGGGVPPLNGYALAEGRLVPMPDGPLGLLNSDLFTPAERDTVWTAFASMEAQSPSLLAGVALADWLDSLMLSGRPRQFLQSLARLASYVDAPNDFSAGSALLQMQEGAAGVIYPDGGWQTIVEKLKSKAETLGVQFVEGEAARGIVPESHGFAAPLSDGEIIRCERAVLAVGPSNIRGLLPPALIESIIPTPGSSVRLATLDLALATLPNPEGGFVLSLDQPLYLSAHSVAARLTPDGGATVSVAKYTRPDDSTPAQILRELEQFMDHVQPGWRAFEVARQYLPSIEVASSFPRADAGGLLGRPRPSALGIPGLYLAGDWVGDQGLLAHASVASGIEAATLSTSSLGTPQRRTDVTRTEIMTPSA